MMEYMFLSITVLYQDSIKSQGRTSYIPRDHLIDSVRPHDEDCDTRRHRGSPRIFTATDVAATCIITDWVDLIRSRSYQGPLSLKHVADAGPERLSSTTMTAYPRWKTALTNAIEKSGNAPGKS